VTVTSTRQVAPRTTDTHTEVRSGADTRLAILACAAALFHERGYGAVSIRDIGSAAGISTSTLYHHFTDKSCILYEITDRFMVDFNEATFAAAQVGGTPTDRIKAIICEHVLFQDRRRGELLTGHHFRRVLDDTQRARVLGLQRAYRNMVMDVVEEGIASGDFVGVDPNFSVSCILDMANGVREWFRETGPMTIDELAVLYADAAVRVCGGSPAGKPSRRKS